MTWYLFFQNPSISFQAINDGVKQLALRWKPHFILAIEDFYFDRLQVPLRHWLYGYLEKHPAFKSHTKAEIISALDGGPLEQNDQVKQILILSRDWLNHLLPFVLSKVNRVHYGLLRRKDILDLSARGYVPSGSRTQVAVPFTGLETPSLASEFVQTSACMKLMWHWIDVVLIGSFFQANPDVAIGQGTQIIVDVWSFLV